MRAPVGVALAAALLVAAGCKPNRDAAPPPDRVTNVRIQVLEPQEAVDRIEIPALVEAWAEVRLSAEVEGRVETVAVDEGDTVDQERTLLEIDAAMLRAQVKQAEASLAAFQAELEKLEAGARPQELEIAEAKVRVAEAGLKQAEAGLAQAEAADESAQRDLARTRQLFQERVVSQEVLDSAQTAATIARRRYDAAVELLRSAEEQAAAARKDLALVREGARAEDRRSAAARVAQAEALLNLAKLRLQKATVKSPAKGILNRRYVEPGEYVGVGARLADVVDISRVKVVAPVPEKDIAFIRLGEPKTVILEAIGRTRTGTVIYQSQTADPRTLTFDVKIALDNSDGAIRPGMIARVVLVRRRLQEAIAVPIFAVLKRDGGYVAYVENDGRVHERRDLRLGFFDGARVIVTAGLEAGDRLIVSGQRDLAEGDRVRVIDPPAPKMHHRDTEDTETEEK